MMLNFFNKYPYTDFHELNLDWLLDRMRKLEDELNNALETLSTEIYNKVMTDIEPMFEGLSNEFAILQANFEGLEDRQSDLEAEFVSLSASVDTKLQTLKGYVDAQVVAAKDYTNTAIEQNNSFLLDVMQTYLAQVKVINYFTGELISVQAMFDYLAGLHTTDSIDYDTMALRAKTYTELAAFNKTYTELAMSANTWFV
ncbi:MAG: hypothetical protein J6S67_14150 [Methanobrevibacter sp.]|nr:hypothetical protein [Methanobrevibacter sp.]